MNIPYGISTTRQSLNGGYGTNPYGGESPASNYYSDYSSQLLQYMNQCRRILSQLAAGDPRRAQVEAYLRTAHQYAEQIGLETASDPSFAGGWDPLAGANGIPNNSSTAANSGPSPDYQDQDKIVFENGASFAYTVDKSETREVHLYQSESRLQIPSNAATIAVTVEPDSALPGKNMAAVTVSFSDGTSRKIYIHHIDRSDAHLNLFAASEGNITLDVSTVGFAKKIKIHKLGDPENSEEVRGTPPDQEEEGTRTWNTHDSVDYFATEGSETDEIYADTVNLTLANRSQSAEITRLSD
jgi:hypothetical protein